MEKFIVGNTYKVRSICDHNCIWEYTVVKRTAKTVTLKDDTGHIVTCRINAYVSERRNKESVYPMGHYSMCPILSA